MSDMATMKVSPTPDLREIEALAVELASIAGGIWKYSSRLGAAGEQLEERQDAKYGVVCNPGTIDAAAHQAREGWVTIP